MGLGINGGGLMTTAEGFAPQREIGVAVNGGGKIDARSINAAAVGAAVNGGGQIYKALSSDAGTKHGLRPCFVIIDELHAYRGVFGSHLANIVRRRGPKVPSDQHLRPPSSALT